MISWRLVYSETTAYIDILNFPCFIHNNSLLLSSRIEKKRPFQCVYKSTIFVVDKSLVRKKGKKKKKEKKRKRKKRKAVGYKIENCTNKGFLLRHSVFVQNKECVFTK